MFSHVINPKDCAICKYCCNFTKINLWDTPLFTEIQKSKYPNISFQKYNKLWTPVLIEALPLFICPFLDVSFGCILGESKPFDCDIWPFYIMKKNSNLVITLCNDCPSINILDYKDLLSILSAHHYRIIETCRMHPDYIREYRDGYKVIFNEGDFL